MTGEYVSEEYAEKVENNADQEHAVLDIIGCVPGGIGMGADLLNSLLYLAEGETGEALKSLVFAFVPGGVGALANYGVKAGKLSEKVLTALNYVQASMNTVGTIIGADVTGNAIAYMMDKYLVQGAEVTSDTLIECMEIAAGGLQTSTSAKGLSDALPKAEIDEYLKESFEYFMADNSGKIGFGNESGSKADLGNKLDYLFGKTSGNKHNIEHSKAMQAELQKIGIHNTPSGREYI